MERTAIPTCCDLFICSSGLLHGQSFGERDDAFQCRAVFFQSVEVQSRQLNRGDLSGFDELRKLRYRIECKVLEVVRDFNIACVRYPKRLLVGVELHTGKNRTERDSGRYAVLKLDHSQSVVAAEMPAKAVEH